MVNISIPEEKFFELLTLLNQSRISIKQLRQGNAGDLKDHNLELSKEISEMIRYLNNVHLSYQ